MKKYDKKFIEDVCSIIGSMIAGGIEEIDKCQQVRDKAADKDVKKYNAKQKAKAKAKRDKKARIAEDRMDFLGEDVYTHAFEDVPDYLDIADVHITEPPF